jgi:hypothetical protein
MLTPSAGIKAVPTILQSIFLEIIVMRLQTFHCQQYCRYAMAGQWPLPQRPMSVAAAIACRSLLERVPSARA